jgi:hypothetical protein
MCVRKTPLAEVFHFSPRQRHQKKTVAFDGGQLTREIILLRSPTTAPEKSLMRGEWPARWEPQEEGMMSIAASFPSVKKPRLCRSGEKSRQCDWRWCLLVCDSFGQFICGASSKLCLLAATRNLHTTQPITLLPTCDEVVNHLDQNDSILWHLIVSFAQDRTHDLATTWRVQRQHNSPYTRNATSRIRTCQNFDHDQTHATNRSNK